MKIRQKFDNDILYLGEWALWKMYVDDGPILGQQGQNWNVLKGHFVVGHKR